MKLPRPELWAELSPLLDELLDLSASAQQVRLAALRQQNPGLAEELAALLSEARCAFEWVFGKRPRPRPRWYRR